MGTSTTPKYRVEATLADPRWSAGPSAWNSKQAGRPTDANLAADIQKLNASMEPGGCNEHLGAEHRVIEARVIRQDSGEVVARYRELS